MSGDWLTPERVEVSLVYARYEKPWAAIYRDLCEEVLRVESLAIEELAHGIFEYLSAPNEEAASERIEVLRLFPIDGGAIEEPKLAVGRGLQVRLLAAADAEGHGAWHVTVDGPLGIAPANSYMIMALGFRGSIPPSGVDIVIHFRHRGDISAGGRCYLARYGESGRHNLPGPTLIYEPEWQSIEYSFWLKPGEEIKRLDFLLALPDRPSHAEIEGLTIYLAPRAKAPSPSKIARVVEERANQGLRAVLDGIARRYALSASEVEDLRERAGLSLERSSNYDMSRFDSWTKEVCASQPTEGAIAARLKRSSGHWRFLRLCAGLSDDVRAHLFEPNPSAVPKSC
jgi:hypothetical protein